MVTIQGVNFYSIDETAKLIGVTKRTLYNWKDDPLNDAKKKFSLSAVISPAGRKFFREEEIIILLLKSWGVKATRESLLGELSLNEKSSTS